MLKGIERCLTIPLHSALVNGTAPHKLDNSNLGFNAKECKKLPLAKLNRNKPHTPDQKTFTSLTAGQKRLIHLLAKYQPLPGKHRGFYITIKKGTRQRS